LIVEGTDALICAEPLEASRIALEGASSRRLFFCVKDG